MDISLNSIEWIHLLLKTYIYDVYLRKKIIYMKLQIEQEENIRYHCDTWEKIASAFYYTKDNQKSYSLVYPSTNMIHSHVFFSSNKPPQYIVVPDYIKDFYNITNISYQTRELLHDLIKNNAIYGIHDVKDDDFLYSKLSHKINLTMKIQQS